MDEDQRQSLVGGTLEPSAYHAYAAYLVRFVTAYRAHGVPIAALSMQNEPGFSPPNYPGMTLSDAQQRTLLGGYVGPAFHAAGLQTTLLVHDHNWDTAGSALSVLSDPTARPLRRRHRLPLLRRGPRRAGRRPPRPPRAADLPDRVRWRHLVAEVRRQPLVDEPQPAHPGHPALVKHGDHLEPRAEPDGRPDLQRADHQPRSAHHRPAHRHGDPNVEYDVLAHIAAFVVPGARRVQSVDPAGVETSAWRNPDGTLVLIAHATGGAWNGWLGWPGADVRPASRAAGWSPIPGRHSTPAHHGASVIRGWLPQDLGPATIVEQRLSVLPAHDAARVLACPGPAGRGARRRPGPPRSATPTVGGGVPGGPPSRRPRRRSIKMAAAVTSGASR